MDEGNQIAVEMKKDRGEIFVNRIGLDEPPKQFTFDHCYDWFSKQVDIYNENALPIVQNVLEGYNGTIFAYGQTGTGKTHTITGEENDPIERGIMPRTFEDIFKAIEDDSVKT